VLCSVLQCITVGYSVLHWCRQAARSAAALRYHTCVLQCVAVCGSVLQCIAVCCSVVDELREVQPRSGTTCVLQCVVMCCSVLQCVAVCCSMLQYVAVGCSVLQCGR